MREKNLVSVIIPIYNVQNYIVECLNSVYSQTYKNIEVILVDDGSTDDSGNICDFYKIRYPNTIVVHQNNQGLSVSRNIGIKMATGDFVLFVDADDYLNKDCIEKLINIVTVDDPDIIIFNFEIVNEKGKENRNLKHSQKIQKKEMLSGKEACELLFQKKIENYSWSMLSKKSIFERNNISFPANRSFEDRATTYKVLLCSKKVVYLPNKLYCYRQRNDSIMHNLNYSKLSDDYLALKERLEYVKQNMPSLYEKCLADTYVTYIGIYRQLDNSEEAKHLKSNILDNISFHFFLFTKDICFSKKIQILFLKLRCYFIINFLINIMEK